MPIFLECQRCTACCRWPGQVKLTEEEISRLAAFKELPEHDFIQRFTRLRPDRRGLALKDKPNGECVFLDGERCSVQAAKPQQCRDFPNLWSFPDAGQSCQAIPREVDENEYRRLIQQATGRADYGDPTPPDIQQKQTKETKGVTQPLPKDLSRSCLLLTRRSVSERFGWTGFD